MLACEMSRTCVRYRDCITLVIYSNSLATIDYTSEPRAIAQSVK